MKAIAIFPKAHEVKLIDHEEPRITMPTQVKLRTLEVGVCGTDKKITSFQFGSPPPGYEYLVIGHEILGEVVEVGSQVCAIKPGDLAVTMVRHLCPHDYCRACRMGRQDFCFTGDFTEHGIKELHGFMTEFVVDEERYLNLVPRELRSEHPTRSAAALLRRALYRKLCHGDGGLRRRRAPFNPAFVAGTRAFSGEGMAYSRQEAIEHFRTTAGMTSLPFIYLSAGSTDRVFCEMLNLAVEAGVKYSGVLCGQATWQDAIPIYATEGVAALEGWLADRGRQNIQALNDVLARGATAWWEA